MSKIIKYLLLFTVLLIFSNVCNAESISGFVFDDSGNPVNNVVITDNATANTTNTNITGYYLIDGYINLTTYIMKASLSGYVDNTLTVNVNGSMLNQNITITEKGRLYDIWELMQDIINNTAVIIGLVIMGVTISIAVYIGAFIQKLLKNTGK